MTNIEVALYSQGLVLFSVGWVRFNAKDNIYIFILYTFIRVLYVCEALTRYGNEVIVYMLYVYGAYGRLGLSCVYSI